MFQCCLPTYSFTNKWKRCLSAVPWIWKRYECPCWLHLLINYECVLCLMFKMIELSSDKFTLKQNDFWYYQHDNIIHCINSFFGSFCFSCIWVQNRCDRWQETEIQWHPWICGLRGAIVWNWRYLFINF